jgi:hypothetical protein
MTIPVEECRKCLPECDLSDEEIIELRITLEAFSHNILDNLFKKKQHIEAKDEKNKTKRNHLATISQLK